jgi:molecular chaperone DnaK
MFRALEDAGLKPTDIDEVVLVGGSTRIPKVQEMVRQITGKEPHKGVNPDEVVAIGAAIQAGVLSGEVKDIVLLDVTPLSLGIETKGGIFTVLIPRNTTIPTRKSEIFTTAADGQTSVEVRVYQGERPMARDNKLLGVFHLDGIPPAPAGIPQIEVTFDIDANGILQVSAKDLGTGRQQSIRITGSTNLTREEVERMIREAEAHAEEDRRARERAEMLNRADKLTYDVERLLKEHQDKVSAGDRERAETLIRDLRSAIQTQDHERVASLMSELESLSYRITEQLYQRVSSEAGSTTSTNTPPPGGDDVIDAEYREER